MNGASKRESVAIKEFFRGDKLTPAERAVSMYFILLPLLWMTGLLLPCGLALIFGLFVLTVPTRHVFSHALPWFAVGLCQIMSVITNLISGGESAAMLLKHCLSSYVLGWFLLGSAIAVGASGQIRSEILLGSIVRLGRYVLLLCIPAYALAFCLQQESLFLLSPLGHFIPESFASRNFSFGMFIYNWEDFLGRPFPRLSLFFPWPTAMGAAGVCMVFICMGVENRRQKLIGIVGGTVMVLASMGRLAFLALAACYVFWLLMKMKPQQAMAIVATGVISLGIAFITPQIHLNEIIAATSQSFNDTREGASEVRDAVYEASWAGFKMQPWFGHGWPGEALFTNDQVFDTTGVMVVGSHSTISGLLYKGGLVTFTAFVCAFFLTVARVAFRSTKNRPRALTVLLAIAFTCAGEGLESLVLPLIFVFLWIGSTISLPVMHGSSTENVRRGKGEAKTSIVDSIALAR